MVFIIAIVFVSSLIAAPVNAQPEPLNFGFVDLNDDHSSSSPFHISHSLCSQSTDFRPAFITSVTRTVNRGVVDADDDVSGNWSANGNWTTRTRYLEPTMMQMGTEDDGPTVHMFIWPEPDRSYDSLNLQKCTSENCDMIRGRLCEIDPKNRPNFFDATPIFRSNEHSPNTTRLVVSRERVDPNVIASDLASIGSQFCGNEACLPYLTYMESRQRCYVECFPIKFEHRRYGQTCGAKVKPVCELIIDDKIIFTGEGSPFGRPEIVKVSFADFTPFNVTLRCKLPPFLAVRTCPSSPGSVCDPRVIVLREGIAIFNSSNNPISGARPEHGQPLVSVSAYPNEGADQSSDLLTLNVTLSFLPIMFFLRVDEPPLMSGNYLFLLSFEGVLDYNPHQDDIPVVLIKASTEISSQLSGLDLDMMLNDKDDREKVGCRLTASGRYDYRGHRTVTQCNDTQLTCLEWYRNVPQDNFLPDFPEYANPAKAENFCRNPYRANQPTNRPWCYVGGPNEKDSWAYCDIPYCDKSLESPPGYKRFNVDCRCDGSRNGPKTNDISICRDFCNAAPDCKGFVLDEAGICVLKTCECRKMGDKTACDPREAKSYYQRENPIQPTIPYLNGETNILVEIHNVEAGLRDFYVRCELIWRPDSAFDAVSWQFYDPDEKVFKEAPKSGESEWVSDNNLARFYLKIGQISSEKFNNRLYRCQLNGERSTAYEYHLVRTIEQPVCTVFFNQISSVSYSFVDFGFNMIVYEHLEDKTVHFPLQWDINCRVSQATVGRCQMNGQVCVPVAILYEDSLQIGNSIYDYDAFKLEFNMPKNRTVDGNQPFDFHLSVFFRNVNRTFPTASVAHRYYTLLFYYPQLAKSHAKYFVKSNFTFDDKLFHTLPSLPLVPLTAGLDSDSYGMVCAVHVEYEGAQLAEKHLQIVLQVPTPIQVDFRCTVKPDRVTGKFCYKEQKDLCYPVSLALRKASREVYVGNWQQPDDEKDGKRIDSEAISPVFRFFSNDPSTLTLRLSTGFDPIDLFNITSREAIITGRYELGLYLDTDTVAKEFIPLNVKLDIAALPTIGVRNNSGDCRPSKLTTDGWFYTGTMMVGYCDNKKCLPWTTDYVKAETDRFKATWLKERPNLPYHFDATEAVNYCRNPTVASIYGLPFCAVGFINATDSVDWRFCDVPFCEDVRLSDKSFTRQFGTCKCGNDTTPGTIQIEPGQDWYYPPSNVSVSVMSHCRAKCLEIDECLGFNYAETTRSCEFKRCRCKLYQDLVEMVSQPQKCLSRVESHVAAVHYYERVQPEPSQFSLESEFGEQFPHDDVAKSELRVHLVDAGSKNVQIGCILLQDHEGIDVGWEVDSETLNYTIVKQSGHQFLQFLDEIAYMAHDKFTARCFDKADKTHFQAHLIRVLTPPECTLDIKYSDGEVVQSTVKSRGYGVTFSRLSGLKDFPDDEREAILTLECSLGNLRQVGLCKIGGSLVSCNPYVKIFHLGEQVYRSYDDQFVDESSSAGNGMRKPDLRMSLDQTKLTVNVAFQPAHVFYQTSMAFYFVPQGVLHFEETVYEGERGDSERIVDRASHIRYVHCYLFIGSSVFVIILSYY